MLDWLAGGKTRRVQFYKALSLSVPCSINRQTKGPKETRVSRAPPIKLLMKVLSSCNTVSDYCFSSVNRVILKNSDF